MRYEALFFAGNFCIYGQSIIKPHAPVSVRFTALFLPTNFFELALARCKKIGGLIK